MSNPDNPYQPGGDQQPQFGQRAEPQGTAQPGSQTPPPERPWPVYSPEQTASQADWGQPQVPPVAPNYGAGAGGPQMSPAVMPGSVKLPSRTGPIWTIVGGVLMSVILAPVLFMALILGGLDFESLVNGTATVYTGSEVTVGDSGSVGLVAQDGSSFSSCTLSNENDSITLTDETGSGFVMGTGVAPGTYTIDCGVGDGRALFVLQGDDISNIYDGFIKGFIWSSVLGVAGIVVFIIGIVWLVRRNRQRREFVRSQWGMQPPLR